jgi:hypothetical protein
MQKRFIALKSINNNFIENLSYPTTDTGGETYSLSEVQRGGVGVEQAGVVFLE